jgi:hypothetical protein
MFAFLSIAVVQFLGTINAPRAQNLMSPLGWQRRP